MRARSRWQVHTSVNDKKVFLLLLVYMADACEQQACGRVLVADDSDERPVVERRHDDYVIPAWTSSIARPPSRRTRSSMSSARRPPSPKPTPCLHSLLPSLPSSTICFQASYGTATPSSSRSSKTHIQTGTCFKDGCASGTLSTTNGPSYGC